MSQNLDATAINQIHALISAQSVNELSVRLVPMLWHCLRISAFMIWKNLI